MELVAVIAVFFLPPLVFGLYLLRRPGIAYCPHPPPVSDDTFRVAARLNLLLIPVRLGLMAVFTVLLFLAARGFYADHFASMGGGRPVLFQNVIILLLPALFSGMIACAVLEAGVIVAALGRDAPFFEYLFFVTSSRRRLARRSGYRLPSLNSRRFRAGLVLVLVVLPLVLSMGLPLLAMNSYALADADALEYSLFFSLDTVRQPYEAVEAITWNRYREAPIGTWRKSPHGVIRFADATTWHTSGFSDPKRSRRFIEAVAERAGVPVRVLDGRPGNR